MSSLSPGPVLLLLLLVLAPSAGLQISQSSASSSLVAEGSNTTLTCATDAPWFFCLWNSPHNDRHCAIQESTPVSVCTSRDEDLVLLTGTPTSCTLHVTAANAAAHHGDWMCLLNDIRDFETVRGRVGLEVATPARLSWLMRPPLTAVRNDAAADGETVHLHLMEGERTNITCVARGGFPAPHFIWEESGHNPDSAARINFGGKETAAEAAVPRSSMESWSMLEYQARLNDSGSNITCRVEQYTPAGDLLYASNILLVLDIAPLVLPLGRAVSEQIGILSGVLLSILLVVLLFTLLMVVMIRRDRRRRRRRKEKQEEYHAEKDKDAESLAPIWRPRGGAGAGDPHHHCQHQHHNQHHQQFQFQALQQGEGRKLGGQPPAPGRKERYIDFFFFLKNASLAVIINYFLSFEFLTGAFC
jgi:hypothetical protein